MRRVRPDKRKYVIILLLILVIVLFRCSHNSIKNTDTYVVGYLPAWSYSCYKDLDWDILTHINIAFVNPDENGNLKCAIPGKVLKDIVATAHHHGVKVEAALGGGGGYAHYTSLTSGKDSMKEFDKKIINWLKKYDMDGIDINIEGDVEKSFWKNYDKWIKDLKKRCKKHDMILSCAVASWFDGYIKDRTLDRFDYVSVMAYDDKADKENPSSFDFAVECLNHFSEDRNVDDGKLLLGIPFYGYRYVDGVCTGKVVTYNEVATYNPGSEHYDSSGTCRYNGIDTVKEKTRLAKKNHKGVMIWSLNQDASGRKSLLRAIGQAIDE